LIIHLLSTPEKSRSRPFDRQLSRRIPLVRDARLDVAARRRTLRVR